jgi:hypothetical protein
MMALVVLTVVFFAGVWVGVACTTALARRELDALHRTLADMNATERSR